ncbi:MAG: pilus assembly protein N-terminal domain-containing protein [Rhizobiaceae bacterium]|nr:pilus assembly protein N-terminal domain-containing protein [Rhizobiaceae bacterium]
MKSTVVAFAISIAVASFSPINATNAAEDQSATDDTIVVTVDRAKIFRVARPARTVIIGNPSIADATVEDERTLVLTGKSFGITNIIILDAAGDPIVDRTIVVRSHEANTVRIYRQSSRETYACAPVCEPTLTIGDNQRTFEFANKQIKARNSLSKGEAAGK